MMRSNKLIFHHQLVMDHNSHPLFPFVRTRNNQLRTILSRNQSKTRTIFILLLSLVHFNRYNNIYLNRRNTVGKQLIQLNATLSFITWWSWEPRDAFSWWRYQLLAAWGLVWDVLYLRRRKVGHSLVLLEHQSLRFRALGVATQTCCCLDRR